MLDYISPLERDMLPGGIWWGYHVRTAVIFKRNLIESGRLSLIDTIRLIYEVELLESMNRYDAVTSTECREITQAAQNHLNSLL